MNGLSSSSKTVSTSPWNTETCEGTTTTTTTTTTCKHAVAKDALQLFKEEGYTSGEASMTLILASLNSLGEDPDAVLQKAEEAREL